MKLLDGKSILFGAGMGIILTALLGIVFFLGTTPEMTDEEIMKRAETLGMVMKSELSTHGISGPAADGSYEVPVSKDESLDSIAFRLAQANLIPGSLEFQILFKKKVGDRLPEEGVYHIPSGCDQEAMVEILLRKP